MVASARRDAGLTQAELARRIGTTQSAVARLEARGSNPRVRTLEAALRACGRRLEVAVPALHADVDETLTARQLRLTPTQRLRGLEQMYREARVIAQAGARARGDVA
jgi:transcriptional regulator with XRE-family HTH domain